jgi:hypothetical protein
LTSAWRVVLLLQLRRTDGNIRALDDRRPDGFAEPVGRRSRGDGGATIKRLFDADFSAPYCVI